MAGEVVWEVVKGVGSFAGFFSTAYILYDRIWKHMPTAVVVARPLMEGSVQITPFLLVTNVATRPILVAWENGDRDSLRIAKSDTASSVVSTLFLGTTTISIDAGSSRQFPLLTPGNYADRPGDMVLSVTLRWKFAQPILWQPERKLKVWMLKSDLDALIGG
jgi:hypothetical protein